MGFSDQNKTYTSKLVDLARKNLVAFDYQTLTVDATVGGVSLTVPAGANYALIEVESSISTPAIRYKECGPTSAVTATSGIRRSNLDAFDVVGYQNLVNFRAIQVAGGVHQLNIQYYR